MPVRSRSSEVLEGVKIRASRIDQGDDLTVDNRIGWQFSKGVGDVWVSFVEVLAVSRVKDRFAVGFDSDGAITVELNLVNPIRPFRDFRNQSAFHRHDKCGFPFSEGTNVANQGEAWLLRICGKREHIAKKLTLATPRSLLDEEDEVKRLWG